VPRVFVSYSHNDESSARGLKTALEDHGLTVWFAADEINPGERVADRVREGLASANSVVLLIGSETSDWTRYEWSEALQRSWGHDQQAPALLAVVLPDAETPSFARHQPLVKVGRTPDWERIAEAVQLASTGRTFAADTDEARKELGTRLKEVEEAVRELPDDLIVEK
jgi:hypothetical protein